MSSNRSKPEPGKASNESLDEQWQTLTWNHLRVWSGSGSVSRGRSYQRNGAVSNLVRTADGRLLATVQGTSRYFTAVWWEMGQGQKPTLRSRCSCPVGLASCKHAVAVVSAYLQALADQIAVPDADPEDARWDRLGSSTDEDSEIGRSGWGEEQLLPDDPAELAHGSEQSLTRRIRDELAGRSREALLELVMKLVDRFPELREEFGEQVTLRQSDAPSLVKETRQEIRDVTGRPGMYDRWSHEGYTPDFSRIERRLERLIELGHADAVVKLGKELLKRGISQAGQSLDEGETASALGDSLPVVFKGLERSSLTGSEKLLFAIDACLLDSYGIIGRSADPILEAEYPQSDWSTVADALRQRLGPAEECLSSDFHETYSRGQIADWLSHALKKAGRDDEIVALFIQEAPLTRSYDRLVGHLIERKRYDEAQAWAQEGIEQTRKQWPGIAWQLAGQLAAAAEKRKQWDVAASHAAMEFFWQPSHTYFKKLNAAAKKAGCGTPVREQALRFLETGQLPFEISPGSSGRRRVTINPDWPLPMPEYFATLINEAGEASPRFDVLLDMALAAKRIDDILYWYGRLLTHRSGCRAVFGRAGDYGESVAEAIADARPDCAVEIYESRLEKRLEEASPTAYEKCVDYLRRMRPLFKKLGREDQWQQRVDHLRGTYRRRPRFIEALEGIDGRSILASNKARRKRK